MRRLVMLLAVAAGASVAAPSAEAAPVQWVAFGYPDGVRISAFESGSTCVYEPLINSRSCGTATVDVADDLSAATVDGTIVGASGAVYVLDLDATAQLLGAGANVTPNVFVERDECAAGAGATTFDLQPTIWRSQRADASGTATKDGASFGTATFAQINQGEPTRRVVTIPGACLD